MKMTVLTAYNQDVQRFFRGAKCNKIRKETIISTIEEAVILMGKSFNKIFPSKRLLVLDEIIFLLSGTGICTIGAEKLAEKAGCSVRTVYSAVKSLKDTGEVLVCQLANKNAGKYIFVLKSHPNFQQILREVFFLDELPEEKAPEAIPAESADSSKNDEVAGLIASHFAGLENPETIGAVRVNGENQSLNHFNQLSLKQERDIIRATIESEADSTKTSEYMNTYYSNEYQKALYNFIQGPLITSEQIKQSALVLGLRMGNNSTASTLVLARQAVISIDSFLRNSGEIKHTVPALFSMILHKRMELSEYAKLYNIEPISPAPKTTKKIPFYNWLVERE